MQIRSLGWKDPLEKGMETRSSVLTWETPRTEKLGGRNPQGRTTSDATERTHTYSYTFCSFHIYFSLRVSFWKVLLPFLQVQILSSAALQLVMSPLETFFIFVTVGFVSSVSF